MDSKGIRVIKVLSLRKVLGYIQGRQSNPKTIWQQVVISIREWMREFCGAGTYMGRSGLCLGPMHQNGKIVDFWALSYQYRTQHGPLLASSRFSSIKS